MLKISVILLLFANYAHTQNLKEIVGFYTVKQRCWEFNNNWQETTEYEVEVNYATNDSTNLEIHAIILSKLYTLGFNAKNDSLFWIYNHLFLNEDSTTQYVSGNGRIYKDSLDLGFQISDLYDTYKCDCNGNKIRDVPIGIEENTLLNKAITLYPNPVKEELKVLWPILSGKTYNNFKIYNLNGQSVLVNKSQLFEGIKVRGLQAGVYVIHFLNDEVSIASGRFVKIE